jgi:small subunit ribosomal protein S19e
MADIRTIEPGKYNSLLAKALQDIPEFKKPEWVDFVKTGINKERPTSEEGFWYKRAASILRQIYIKGIVGVQRLRTRYGGKQTRGVRPPIKVKGAGKLIRVILQQSEAAGLVEKSTTKKAGRQLTKSGKELMESLVK